MRATFPFVICVLALPLAAAPVPKKPDGPTEAQLAAAEEAFKELGGRHREYKDEPTGPTRHEFIFTLRMSDETVAKLPAVPFPFGLEFESMDLSDAALKQVAALGNLTTLKLTGVSELTEEGLWQLGNAKSLVELDLTGTKLRCRGLSGLTKLSLARLTLNKTHTDDEALVAVGKMTALTTLHLNGTRVTSSGMPRLAGLTKLNELVLDRTDVGDAGVEELAGWKSLTSLSLSNTKVTDTGMKHLAGLTTEGHVAKD